MWSCPGRWRIRPDSWLICLFVLAFGSISAQNTLLERDTLQGQVGDTLALKHTYLTPNSLLLRDADGKIVAEKNYQIDEIKGFLILRPDTEVKQPIFATYRYFPRFLQSTYAFRKFRVVTDSLTGEEFVDVYEDPVIRKDLVLIEASGLRKSGSISRGVTVGNNQNLTVNSGLRLQLEGDLGDDLKMVAAITDENIPIQPDGTTQQIQDFDKVFIKLMKGSHYVILGDFEINHRGTWFANFYRNVQGIGVSVNDKNWKASVNGAVAKGKFHTNSFQGAEGVQGPYRLSGKNNERFIIVLAGSEKVYLNGDLMTRGEGNDYTIDYNSGELTFTSQRIISTASRIVVDFEYTDRFYNRSLLFAESSGSVMKDRLRLKFSYGRDADNRNAPIDGEFSPLELDTLLAVGDDQDRAFLPGIDSVGVSPLENVVQYARVDTIFNGVQYEAYFYTQDPDSDLYRLTFSFVGAGNGYYAKDQSGFNNSVFKWVAPDSSGVPTGDYAPIRGLVLPTMSQVVDLKGSFKVSEKMSIYSETAISSLDRNRLSNLDDQDNFDLANKTGVLLEKLKVGDSLSFKVDLSHRFVGQEYNNLDRVYKVEYGREWNFNDLGERLDENVSEARVEMNYKNKVTAVANAGLRTFGDRLLSVKQRVDLSSQHSFLQGKYTFTTIGTEDKVLKSFSRWTRHNGDIYKKLGKLKPGVVIWTEDKSNEIEGESSNGAFRFYDFKPYIKTDGSEKLQMELSYNYRKEFEFQDTLDRGKALSHTGFAKIVYNPISNLSLQNTSSYRDFKVLDTLFLRQGLNNNRTFITNLQATGYTPKRLLFGNLIYEITSEQLARRDVAYIRVNEGQGQYEWIDLDSNEVETLDEFQISTNPLRANFVRVLVPTRDLFPTTAVNFGGNLKIDFKRRLKRSKNVPKEILRNFTSITNFRVSQKKEAGGDLSSYLVNPGNLFGDSTLLDAQYTLRQDIYFFRNNPVGDFKLSYADNQSKLFLSTGDEVKTVEQYSTAQRLNFGKSKSFENEARMGVKTNQTQAFDSRNYNIRFREIKPSVNFQISRKFRFSTGYEYKNKINRDDTLATNIKVNFHKLFFDAKINLKERNNIFTRLELVNIIQDGEGSFSAEYEMRESLQPGFNAIWQVFFTYYLSKSLELSTTYDGRASQDNRILHSGRIQIKAFF